MEPCLSKDFVLAVLGLEVMSLSLVVTGALLLLFLAVHSKRSYKIFSDILFETDSSLLGGVKFWLIYLVYYEPKQIDWGFSNLLLRA